MAFWMDPFLLIGIGIAVAWITKKWFYETPFFIPAISALILFVFLGISIGMFLNVEMLSGSWKALGAGSGTEYMINGIIFDFVAPGAVWTSLPSWAMLTCIFMFILYPFWLWLGIVFGRLLFGRHPRQSGIVGLMRPQADFVECGASDPRTPSVMNHSIAIGYMDITEGTDKGSKGIMRDGRTLWCRRFGR